MNRRNIFIIFLIAFISAIPSAAQDRYIPIESEGWNLWLDRKAEWKNDPLFLPPVDVSELPVNPPTCGWENLFREGVVSFSEAGKTISDSRLSLEIKVPGTVEEYYWDAVSGSSNGHWTSGNYEGVSWWGKTFSLPNEASGKRIKLFFSEGVRQRAEVFVNEILVAYELVHQSPFEVDITDAVKFGGLNKLAVRITDANGNFSWGDFDGELWGEYYFPQSHGFGGILGEVGLKIVHPLHVEDIFVKNKPSLKDIDIDIEIVNEGSDSFEGSIHIEIIEAWKNNSAVTNPQTVYSGLADAFKLLNDEKKTYSFSASVPDASLWGIKDANLYNLIVSLKDKDGNLLDKSVQRFGFRFLSIEGYGSDARFYLNGKRTFLLSAISWGFWPTNGMYPTPELARKHIEAAQGLGQNMLNFHRCRGNNTVLNLADEMGILYYEEPGGYSSSRIKSESENAQKAKNFELATQLNSQRLLRMVKDHRNHPSLVIYNMVNEPHWDPDNQAKEDMAKAHELDPTRFISYGSGFMDPQSEQPQKLHTLSYDPTQRTKGFVDIHNAGNSAGVYIDAIYTSPSNYWRNDLSKDEVFIWGEEAALASPPQLEMIQNNIAEVGYNGWDGADYKRWYEAYRNYIDKKDLAQYYPDMTQLITSLGDIMYYEHGRLLENARIADGAEAYILNGFEDMKLDNFSGTVDVFRNYKGTPELISQYIRPLMVSVKLRDKIGIIDDVNLFDLYVLNEHAVPAGEYEVKAFIKKPDGKEDELYSGTVKLSGGDTFSNFVEEQIPVKLDGGIGYYYITAGFYNSNGEQIADGHDEIFAVDWKSDKIETKGAVMGSIDFLNFIRDVKQADAVAYDESLGKLDYIVLGMVDDGTQFRSLSPSYTRTEDNTVGLNLEYYRGKSFNQLIDTRISTARLDFNLQNKLIPGWDMLGNTNFSLRWEGNIIVEASGLIEFEATYDDGVRIWINNNLVLNDWNNGAERTSGFKIHLEEGKSYPVKIEVFQDGGTWLFSLKRKIPVSNETFDLDKLLRRVTKDGTTLLILEDAENWIKELQMRAIFPSASIFHPAKTWVGHNFFVREHPFFENLPVNKGMNWEYQQLVVYEGPSHFGLYNMEGEEAIVSLVGGADHLVSTSVGIIPAGKGNIVFSSLDLEPNLMSDAKAAHVPKKILCNIFKWTKDAPSNPVLDRQGWIVTASSSASSGEIPEKTLDADLNSRWSSGVFQSGGEWFMVDMLEPQAFNRIVLKQGNSPDDYPRKYEVYVSDDGTEWSDIIQSGEGTAGEETVISLPDLLSRYLKIVQTGKASAHWWSIAEFYLEQQGTVSIENVINAEKSDDVIFYSNGRIGTKNITPPFRVELFNSLGMKLKSFVTENTSFAISGEAGIHIVNISDSKNNNYSKKIVLNNN